MKLKTKIYQGPLARGDNSLDTNMTEESREGDSAQL